MNSLWRVTPASFAHHISHGVWKPARHLSLISTAIAKAVHGIGPRNLIISLPPRHGKSWLISKYTPAWLLENFPDRRVICSTHTASFAEKWGKEVRNIIAETPELTVELRKDSKRANEWSTPQGGGMKTSGVGSAIIGWGADIFIIDDPHSGWEAISSIAHRRKAWEWWQADAMSRLEPGSCVILLMQRLHHEDLAGKILKHAAENPKAMQFEYIRLPMLCDDHDDALGRQIGEALWPERFDVDAAELIKHSKSDELMWMSQYQQRPPKDGGYDRTYHAFTDSNVWHTELEWNPQEEVIWSLDFNIDPMCSVIMQKQELYDRTAILTGKKNQQLYVLDEICLPNATTLDACREFESRTQQWARSKGVLQVRVYGDAAGRHRNSSAHTATTTDYTLIREYFRSKSNYRITVDVPTKNPARKDRYNAVNAMLRSASGRCRLFIDPKCKRLKADFKDVSFRRDASGNVTALLDNSDPNLTHVSDALGYGVERMFGLRPESGSHSGILQ